MRWNQLGALFLVLWLLLICLSEAGPLEESVFYHLDSVELPSTDGDEVCATPDPLDDDDSDPWQAAAIYPEQARRCLGVKLVSLVGEHGWVPSLELATAMVELSNMALRFGRLREAWNWNSLINRLNMTSLLHDFTEYRRDSLVVESAALHCGISASDLFPFDISSSFNCTSWFYDNDQEVPFPGCLTASMLSDRTQTLLFPHLRAYQPTPGKILFFLQRTELRGVFMTGLHTACVLGHVLPDPRLFGVVTDATLSANEWTHLTTSCKILPQNIFHLEIDPSTTTRFEVLSMMKLELVAPYFLSSRYLAHLTLVTSFRPSIVWDHSTDSLQWLSHALLSPPHLVTHLMNDLSRKKHSPAFNLQTLSQSLTLQAIDDSSQRQHTGFHLLIPSVSILPPRLLHSNSYKVYPSALRLERLIFSHHLDAVLPNPHFIFHQLQAPSETTTISLRGWQSSALVRPLVICVNKNTGLMKDLCLMLFEKIASLHPEVDFILVGTPSNELKMYQKNIASRGLGLRVHLLIDTPHLPLIMHAMCSRSPVPRRCVLLQPFESDCSPAFGFEALMNNISLVSLNPMFVHLSSNRSVDEFLDQISLIYQDIVGDSTLFATENFADRFVHATHIMLDAPHHLVEFQRVKLFSHPLWNTHDSSMFHLSHFLSLIGIINHRPALPADFSLKFLDLIVGIFPVSNSTVSIFHEKINLTHLEDCFGKQCIHQVLVFKPNPHVHENFDRSMVHLKHGMLRCKHRHPASPHVVESLGILAEALHDGLEALDHWTRSAQMQRSRKAAVADISRIRGMMEICGRNSILSRVVFDLEVYHSMRLVSAENDITGSWFAIPECYTAGILEEILSSVEQKSHSLESISPSFISFPARAMVIMSFINNAGGMQKQILKFVCHLLDNDQHHGDWSVLLFVIFQSPFASQLPCHHHVLTGRIIIQELDYRQWIPELEQGTPTLDTLKIFQHFPHLPVESKAVLADFSHTISTWKPSVIMQASHAYDHEFLTASLLFQVPTIFLHEGIIQSIPVGVTSLSASVAINTRIEFRSCVMKMTQTRRTSNFVVLPIGDIVRQEQSQLLHQDSASMPLLRNLVTSASPNDSQPKEETLKSFDQMTLFEQQLFSDLHSLKQGGPVRIVCGIFRISPQKDPLLWLQVAESYNATPSSVHFLLVGPPEETSLLGQVESAMAQHSWIHYLNYTDVIEIWQTEICDAQLHTAVFEGLASVAIEAILHDIPFVTTPAAGTMYEVFVPGSLGSVVADSSIQGLRRELDRWLAAQINHELLAMSKQYLWVRHHPQVLTRSFSALFESGKAFSSGNARVITVVTELHVELHLEAYLRFVKKHAPILTSQLNFVLSSHTDAQLAIEGASSALGSIPYLCEFLRLHRSQCLANIRIPWLHRVEQAVAAPAWLVHYGLVTSVDLPLSDPRFVTSVVLIQERIASWLATVPLMTGASFEVDISSAVTDAHLEFLVHLLSSISYHLRTRLDGAYIVVKFVENGPRQKNLAMVKTSLTALLDTVDLVEFGPTLLSRIKPAIIQGHRHQMSWTVSDDGRPLCQLPSWVRGGALAVYDGSPSLEIIFDQLVAVFVHGNTAASVHCVDLPAIHSSFDLLLKKHHRYELFMHQSTALFSQLTKLLSHRPAALSSLVVEHVAPWVLQEELLMSLVDPKLKTEGPSRVAVCAIVRREIPYIQEWITHHLLIGVSHFYLYNNEVHQSDDMMEVARSRLLEQVLLPFAPFVTFIDWPGYQQQKAAYQHCLDQQHLTSTFDWLGFIDIDEFVVIHELQGDGSFLSLSQWLAQPKFVNASSVVLHWALFGSDSHIFADPSVMTIQRFQHRRESPTPIYKSFVRPSRCSSVSTVHQLHCDTAQFPMLDAGGREPCSLHHRVQAIFAADSHLPPLACHDFGFPKRFPDNLKEADFELFCQCDQFRYAQLNHYLTRSLEEFLAKSVSPLADQALMAGFRSSHLSSRGSIHPFGSETMVIEQRSGLPRWVACHPHDPVLDSLLWNRHGSLMSDLLTPNNLPSVSNDRHPLLCWGSFAHTVELVSTEETFSSSIILPSADHHVGTHYFFNLRVQRDAPDHQHRFEFQLTARKIDNSTSHFPLPLASQLVIHTRHPICSKKIRVGTYWDDRRGEVWGWFILIPCPQLGPGDRIEVSFTLDQVGVFESIDLITTACVDPLDRSDLFYDFSL